MEANVKALIEQENYYTEITTGAHTIIADEPLDLGGKDKGFDPMELLTAALSACTLATLKMYMDRKNWTAQKIDVEIHLDNNRETRTTTFTRTLHFEGTDLTEEQIKRLHQIAEACPVHKALTGEITINTRIK
ncbi:OsmC family protein [Flavobacterium sp. NRK F10]|uniref:OsmC family protein n=1 Tax=Flavobacterium sp. NRK F10 TaxID=2954931 RepID=UPI002090B83F|nr:OsmC family protein [Flavobacterium sp. NRK F10]MCO6173518.1 OsmC family protein [Flavobacterium sp. NRK F10]